MLQGAYREQQEGAGNDKLTDPFSSLMSFMPRFHNGTDSRFLGQSCNLHVGNVLGNHALLMQLFTIKNSIRQLVCTYPSTL